MVRTIETDSDEFHYLCVVVSKIGPYRVDDSADDYHRECRLKFVSIAFNDFRNNDVTEDCAETTFGWLLHSELLHGHC